VSTWLFLNSLEGAAQVPAYIEVTQAGCPLPGNDAVVSRGEQTFIVPVKFPDKPFEAISRNCVPDLAAYGYADAYVRVWRFGPKNDESGGLDLAPLTGYPQKFRSFQEPFMPGKTGHGSGSYLAAMVTARRLRPLARRLLMTSRPFLVDIRTRNPWVLFREVLLG
jgi:hypothetical protein